MDSQDSLTVIPCSEEITFEESDTGSSTARPLNLQSNSEDMAESQSQSLLADCNDISNRQEISSINISSIDKTKSLNNTSSLDRNSVSNMEDLESSEVNPMSSTRIEENSMSMLNEGFMIDSACLSLSAVNEDSRLDPKKTSSETQIDDTINGEEALSLDVEADDEEEIMEEDEPEGEGTEERTTTTTRGRKRKGPVEAVESDEDEDDENTADYPVPQFPMARVKKIMQCCMAAEDNETEVEVINTKKGTKGQVKGKGNMIITKEAIYLTTLATEHFINVIGGMAGKVTVSSKKKTLTLEHLKRALSDTDAFAFLEGCFQPSLIIGD